jgi:hypothetical protein
MRSEKHPQIDLEILPTVEGLFQGISKHGIELGH